MLLSHIIAACVSLVYATILYFKPSRAGLMVNLGLVLFALASGTYLVITLGAHVLASCLTGFFYVGVISIQTALAFSRLARITAD